MNKPATVTASPRISYTAHCPVEDCPAPRNTVYFEGGSQTRQTCCHFLSAEMSHAENTRTMRFSFSPEL
jgi:hypothetical protein